MYPMSTPPPFFRFESKSEFPGKKLRKFVHANIFTIVIQEYPEDMWASGFFSSILASLSTTFGISLGS